MKILLQKLKRQVERVKALFPTALPNGMSEFHEWANSIISLYSFPDNDSLRWTLANMIMHAPSEAAYKSKHYFASRVKKAMANQVAAQVVQDLKQKQAEANATAATQVPNVAV